MCHRSSSWMSWRRRRNARRRAPISSTWRSGSRPPRGAGDGHPSGTSGACTRAHRLYGDAGISLRARIARHYRDAYNLLLDPARVVTTGSSGGFMGIPVTVRAGRPCRLGQSRLSAISPHTLGARMRAGANSHLPKTRVGLVGKSTARGAPAQAAEGRRDCKSSRIMHHDGCGRANALDRGRRSGSIRSSHEIYHGLHSTICR